MAFSKTRTRQRVVSGQGSIDLPAARPGMKVLGGIGLVGE